MTNEKAIMCLEDMRIKVPIPKAAKQARENNEALDVAIKALQSAEPKSGKWIDTKGNTEGYAREYECSECGGTMLGESNFCPNCGADMREVTE
jgi:rubrerythrin